MRCRNWTEHGETESLINLRLQSLRNKENVNRFGMNESNEPVWEAISKQLPERTPEQCQNRWDTVVRSYKTIKSHLDDHGKQFSQVTGDDFEKMQAAQCFRSAEWYKIFGEHREVWDHSHRSKGRRSANMNGASGMPALSSAESVKSDAFPPEVVNRTSPLDRSEPTVLACELPVKQSQSLKLASSTSTVCWFYCEEATQTQGDDEEVNLFNHNAWRSVKAIYCCSYAHITDVHVQVINCGVGLSPRSSANSVPMEEDGQVSFPRAHISTWGTAEPS